MTSLLLGYECGKDIICRAGYGDYQQHGQPAFSSSMASQTQKPLPAICTKPAQAPATSAASIVEDSGMRPGSISRNENTDLIPMLDGTTLTPDQMPVDPGRSGFQPEGASHNCMVTSRTAFADDHPPAAVERHLNQSATTSRTQSPNFSPISSRPDSFANTVWPVPPTQPRDSVDQENIVMRSNLNGSRNRRTRQGSVRKHVMSFMEFDAENESVCSSQRSSLQGVP